jgi:hypothetical protein
MARSSRWTVSGRTRPGGAALFPPVIRSAAVMLPGCHGFRVLNPLDGAVAAHAGLDAGRNHGKIVLLP